MTKNDCALTYSEWEDVCINLGASEHYLHSQLSAMTGGRG